MILIEEQRDAIEYAINSLEQCGSEPEDLVVVKILQAMIDSGDHIPDATKMVGFDLKRVRAWNERQKEILKERFHCACGTCHACGFSPDQMDEALAEIERLREVIKTHNTREESALAEILMNELLVRQNAQIKELEAENKRVLLELQKSKNRNMCEERVKKDMQQAARIKELEDALVEEWAKQFDVDEPCPARTHHEYCDILKGLCDGFPHMWKQCPRKPEKLDAARQQLQAEGKIGPDAKPHCWQITEERKAAILHCKRMLAFLKEDDAPCYDVEKITKDESVLVAMLEEADHDKP